MTWGLTNAAWDIAPMSCSNRNGQEDQPPNNERVGLSGFLLKRAVVFTCRQFTFAIRFSQRNRDSFIRYRLRCIIERDFVTMGFRM
jgi:hypothetical protein